MLLLNLLFVLALDDFLLTLLSLTLYDKCLLVFYYSRLVFVWNFMLARMFFDVPSAIVDFDTDL